MTSTVERMHDSFGADAAVSLRRHVNDEVARTAERYKITEGDRFQFVCECGDLTCRQLVTLTLTGYAASPPGSVLAH